jgi:hypothetical protein
MLQQVFSFQQMYDHKRQYYYSITRVTIECGNLVMPASQAIPFLLRNFIIFYNYHT